MPNPIPLMTEATRKRITIPAKPADPDAWVHQAAPAAPAPQPAEDLVRLSVDVPKAVRKALKSYVNDTDTTIQDLVRQLIADHLGDKGYL